MAAVRFFAHRGDPAEDEAARLRDMTVDDHLDAAALEQGRASNPGPGDTEDSAAGHEDRAQTHLLWAIALRLDAEPFATYQVAPPAERR